MEQMFYSFKDVYNPDWIGIWGSSRIEGVHSPYHASLSLQLHLLGFGLHTALLQQHVSSTCIKSAKLKGVIFMTSKAVFDWPCRAAPLQHA